MEEQIVDAEKAALERQNEVLQKEMKRLKGTVAEMTDRVAVLERVI